MLCSEANCDHIDRNQVSVYGVVISSWLVFSLLVDGLQTLERGVYRLRKRSLVEVINLFLLGLPGDTKGAHSLRRITTDISNS